MNAMEGDEGDLTRKQRREQARTERKELEQAEAARAVRRKRLSLLGIVAAAVVAIIVVVLIVSGGNSTKVAPKPGSTSAVASVTEVEKLLAGIPQQGNVLGNPNAPVTIKYFGDLECPVCRAFTERALPSVINTYVRQGKVKIEYNSMETATREPEVFKTQQIAALAAGKQNKMWPYLEIFYHQQGEEDSGYVTESYLQGLAKQVKGLNLAQWTSDRSEPGYNQQLEKDAQPEKVELTSPEDPSSLDASIEKALKS